MTDRLNIPPQRDPAFAYKLQQALDDIAAAGGGGSGVTAVTGSGGIVSTGGTTPDISLPVQTGNSGKVLGTNGTTASWVAAGGVTAGFAFYMARRFGG